MLLFFLSLWERAGTLQASIGGGDCSENGSSLKKEAARYRNQSPPIQLFESTSKKKKLNLFSSSQPQQQASPSDADPSADIGALLVSATGTLTYWHDLSDATSEPRVASLQLGGRVAKVAAVANAAAGKSDDDLFLPSFVSVIARDDGALFRVDGDAAGRVRVSVIEGPSAAGGTAAADSAAAEAATAANAGVFGRILGTFWGASPAPLPSSAAAGTRRGDDDDDAMPDASDDASPVAALALFPLRRTQQQQRRGFFGSSSSSSNETILGLAVLRRGGGAEGYSLSERREEGGEADETEGQEAASALLWHRPRLLSDDVLSYGSEPSSSSSACFLDASLAFSAAADPYSSPSSLLWWAIADDGRGGLVALALEVSSSGGDAAAATAAASLGQTRRRAVAPLDAFFDDSNPSSPTSLSRFRIAASSTGELLLWEDASSAGGSPPRAAAAAAAAAAAWEPGLGAAPLPLSGGCLGAAAAAQSASLIALDGAGRALLLPAGRAVETAAAAAAAGASPGAAAAAAAAAPAARSTRSTRATAAAAASSPPAASAAAAAAANERTRRSTRLATAAIAPASLPQRRRLDGGGGDARESEEEQQQRAPIPARAPVPSAATPADEAAIFSVCDAAAAQGGTGGVGEGKNDDFLPSRARDLLLHAGALRGGAAAGAVGAYAVRAADALAKAWGGSGAGGGSSADGSSASAASSAIAGGGIDAALQAKAAANRRLVDGLAAAEGALSALDPGLALRPLLESGERVAAASALRSALNASRAAASAAAARGGAVGASDSSLSLDPLASLVAAAGAAALPSGPAGAARRGEEAFFSAPARSLPAMLLRVPAATQEIVLSSSSLSPSSALAALSALRAGVDSAFDAALSWRTVTATRHPAAAVLALRGGGGTASPPSPDWLSDRAARMALAALADASLALLPALASEARGLLLGAASGACSAVERALSACARAAASRKAAGGPAGPAATAGEEGGEGEDDESYAAAAASWLSQLLAAAASLAESDDENSASLRLRQRVEALAHAHGAHEQRYAALLSLGDPRLLHSALAEATGANSNAAPKRGRHPPSSTSVGRGTFADFAFSAMLSSTTPSQLLELPSQLNEPLHGWLSLRVVGGRGSAAAATTKFASSSVAVSGDPQVARAARIAWLHDLRTRRYLGASATLSALALRADEREGGVLPGRGAVLGKNVVVPSTSSDAVANARSRAARLAKLAALAAAPNPSSLAGLEREQQQQQQSRRAAAGSAFPSSSSSSLRGTVAAAAAATAEAAEAVAAAAAALQEKQQGQQQRTRRAGSDIRAPPPPPLLPPAVDLALSALSSAAEAGTSAEASSSLLLLALRLAGAAADAPLDRRAAVAEAAFSRLSALTKWGSDVVDARARLSDAALRGLLAATPLAAGAALCYGPRPAACLLPPGEGESGVSGFEALLPATAALSAALRGAADARAGDGGDGDVGAAFAVGASGGIEAAIRASEREEEVAAAAAHAVVGGGGGAETMAVGA